MKGYASDQSRIFKYLTQATVIRDNSNYTRLKYFTQVTVRDFSHRTRLRPLYPWLVIGVFFHMLLQKTCLSVWLLLVLLPENLPGAKARPVAVLLHAVLEQPLHRVDLLLVRLKLAKLRTLYRGNNLLRKNLGILEYPEYSFCSPSVRMVLQGEQLVVTWYYLLFILDKSRA